MILPRASTHLNPALQLTQVVPEKRPLNGFNSSCSSIGDLVSRAVEHVAMVTCVSEQCEN